MKNITGCDGAGANLKKIKKEKAPKVKKEKKVKEKKVQSPEEKAQFDELYERINEVASKRGMKDIPVQFFYGAI